MKLPKLPIPNVTTAKWHGTVIQLGKVYSDPALRAFTIPLYESGSKK